MSDLPEILVALKAQIAAKGGATINPRTENGTLVDLSKVGDCFCVAARPDLECILPSLDALTAHSLAAFCTPEVVELLEPPDTFLGFWLDDAGRLFLDVSRIIGVRHEAFALGFTNRQQAIYDCRRGQCITI